MRRGNSPADLEAALDGIRNAIRLIIQEDAPYQERHTYGNRKGKRDRCEGKTHIGGRFANVALPHIRIALERAPRPYNRAQEKNDRETNDLYSDKTRK